MQDCLDYYKLLQVDRSAEPEVVEGAYKRLAKKYHPDVNGSLESESFMKLLNEAYSVLSDPALRKNYDLEWEKRYAAQKQMNANDQKNVDIKLVAPAKNVLVRYFTSIMNRDFKQAYDLISSADRGMINLDDFLKWQNTVSKVFQMKRFECEARNHETNVTLGGTTYEKSVGFYVVVSEYNAVMDRLERDILNRRVVRESGNWRIYIGYGDVRPFIERFDNLSVLVTAKSTMNEFVENYSRIDHVTGLCNREGFFDLAEKEVQRNKRYGNRFSLMMIRFGNPAQDKVLWTSAGDDCMARLGRELSGILRKLDAISRWDDSAFIVLLPETGFEGAAAAAKKIRRKLDSFVFSYGGREYRPSAVITVSEFLGALGATIHRLILLAGKPEEPFKDRIATGFGKF